jgi:hypothetical protein
VPVSVSRVPQTGDSRLADAGTQVDGARRLSSASPTPSVLHRCPAGYGHEPAACSLPGSAERSPVTKRATLDVGDRAATFGGESLGVAARPERFHRVGLEPLLHT